MAGIEYNLGIHGAKQPGLSTQSSMQATTNRTRQVLYSRAHKATLILGNGFLNHPASKVLRDRLSAGNLSPRDFYQQILHLTFRFLILFIAEGRNLVPLSGPESRDHDDRNDGLSPLFDHRNLWQEYIRQIFRLNPDPTYPAQCGMTALGGRLFDAGRVHDLVAANIGDEPLLAALHLLRQLQNDEAVSRIDYSALNPEDPGAAYEYLLDYRPVITVTENAASLELIPGSERKKNGAYYTPPELVNELIRSTLEPVIHDRIEAAGDAVSAREHALLSMTVCDPACGSGNFLLAAARRMGLALARVRTGADSPAPEAIHQAVNEVIQHCIYGVDNDPLASAICQAALWLECADRQLTLRNLDHHVKHGDALLGVFDLTTLREGIPDGAYIPLTGDDKPFAATLRKQNKHEQEAVRQTALPELAPGREALQAACDVWTSAFHIPKKAAYAELVPTTALLARCLDQPASQILAVEATNAAAHELHYFHWPLEFPEVFANGGFDVILCNPPWDRLRFQEIDFFSTRIPEIAHAKNAAARQKMIEALVLTQPGLAEELEHTKQRSEAIANFYRSSGRFPLTSRGDVDTYSVFAELARTAISPRGRAGLIVPSGIATDERNKFFFDDLVDTGQLVSLYDFENYRNLFPGVGSGRFKFCLLTIAGSEVATSDGADYVFFAHSVADLTDNRRRFRFSKSDLHALNPNTRTSPVFRTHADADLVRKIQRRFPVLIDEQSGSNPWDISFSRSFEMANHSHLFRTREQLEAQGYNLTGNQFQRGASVYLPLYEAKMFWQFDHRFGDYRDYPPGAQTARLPNIAPERLANPNYQPLPRYWVREIDTLARALRFNSAAQRQMAATPTVEALRPMAPRWLLAFRDITNATNERTVVFCMLPCAGVGHTAPLILSGVWESNPLLVCCFLANANALVFDYVARQKLGGMHLTYTVLKQLPFLPPATYTQEDVNFIVPRVLRLVYTAWDVQPFAQDMGCFDAPFVWDADERAQLRAELDAYYAHLYGLTRTELRYVLDPEDVYGADYPGVTFRILKKNERRQFGEYRSQRLILAAWDRLFGSS